MSPKITNDPGQLRLLCEAIAPVCRAHRLELVDARFYFEQGVVLRVLIERGEAGHPAGGGVTLADCQAVSEDLSVALDANLQVVTPAGYRLEVSSPGLDRPLFKLDDFRRFQGQEIKLQTARTLAGRRRFQGKLLAVEGENIRVEQDGAPVLISYQDIHKANLCSGSEGERKRHGQAQSAQGCVQCNKPHSL